MGGFHQPSRTVRLTQPTGAVGERQIALSALRVSSLRPAYLFQMKMVAKTLGLVLLLLSVLFVGSVASAQSVSATFEVVKPALALLSYTEQGNTHFGSAFCVRSTGAASYFLTNRHVVGSRTFVNVDLVGAREHTFTGTVVAQSSSVDAAMVRVDVPNVQTLQLATDAARVGQAVSIVGFPLFAVRYLLSSHNLVPSMNSGTVNAVLFDGAFLEYDAQTDQGNSGGPIVDSTTGKVYGMVTYVFAGASPVIQNNVGVSISDFPELLTSIRLAGPAGAVPSQEALHRAQVFFSSTATSMGATPSAEQGLTLFLTPK